MIVRASRSLWPATVEGRLRCDENGVILDADEAACRLTSRSRVELAGLRLGELAGFPDGDAGALLRHLPPESLLLFDARFPDTDASFRARLSVAVQDGVRSCRIRFEHARRAWDQLSRDPELLRALLGMPGTLHAVYDLEGRVLLFNPACEALSGFSFDEVRGKAFWDVVVPSDDRTRAEAALRASRPADFPRRGEREWVTRSGERRWVSWSEAALEDDAGAVRYFLLSGVDVTRRVREAEAHRGLAALVECSAQAVLSLDLRGRVLALNAPAQRLMERREDEALREPLQSLLAWESMNGAAEILDLVKGGRCGCLETRVLLGAGRVVDLEVSTSPIHDSRGELAGGCLLLRDITERKRAEETLRRRHALLMEGEALARLGSWEWAVSENALFWSDELFEIFGLTRDNFVPTYTAYLDHVAPEDRERVREILDDSLRTGRSFAFRHAIVRPTGERRMLNCRGRVIANADGRPARLVGSAYDDTESWTREEELRRSEERFRTAARLARDFIYERDVATGRMTWFGDMAGRLGYSPAEFPGSFEGWSDLVHPDDRLAVVEAAEKRATMGRPYAEDYRVRARDGSFVWVEDRGTVLETGAWVGAARDVTELRQRARREAAEYEISRILTASASLSDAGPRALAVLCEWMELDTGILWTLDEEHRTLRFLSTWQRPGVEPIETEAILKELRFSPGRGLAGRVWESGRAVWIPDVTADPNVRPDPLARSGRGRGALGFPLIVEKSLVGVLEFLARDVREPDAATMKTLGALAGQLGQFLERERGQALIRNLNRDLERRVDERTRDLNDVVNELQAFSYTVAHDLRAPLRAMSGYSGILMEEFGDALGPEGLDYARRVGESAWRMDGLLQAVLAYSRLSRQDVESRPVELEEILRAVESEVAAELAALGGVLSVDRPLPRVVAHAAMLTQAVLNLVQNALKFVPSGVAPRIRVRAQEVADGRTRLWVEDNGIGIAPEHHERVFRIFERLHAPAAFPGTGLGLAIVKRAVERMGGRVGVESRLGEGSRFWVELPAAC